MTYELRMVLSGRGFAFIRDAAILSLYKLVNIIHQALGNPRNGIGIWHLTHTCCIRRHTVIYIPNKVQFLGHTKVTN